MSIYNLGKGYGVDQHSTSYPMSSLKGWVCTMSYYFTQLNTFTIHFGVILGIKSYHANRHGRIFHIIQYLKIFRIDWLTLSFYDDVIYSFDTILNLNGRLHAFMTEKCYSSLLISLNFKLGGPSSLMSWRRVEEVNRIMCLNWPIDHQICVHKCPN